jgi:hypothetical protein
VSKYALRRRSAEEQLMDERVRAIAERNGIARSEVKVSFVEPRSSNGATANGNASSNGNGNGGGNGHRRSGKARFRKQDVASAAARFPDGFTLAQIAAAVGCSPGAAKQHAVSLAADGVLAKTGETRERGAAIWKLCDDSQAGAQGRGHAKPPGGANPTSAADAGSRYPAVPAGSGRHEPPDPVTAMSEQSEPAERLISDPEHEPTADPITLALAELARRRQVLDAADQALAAVANL